jgi:hypothetical protein
MREVGGMGGRMSGGMMNVIVCRRKGGGGVDDLGG